LNIDLHQEFAAVSVRYQMQNAGSNTLQDFFFPVELWNDDLEDYQIQIDDKPIKWETVEGVKKPLPQGPLDSPPPEDQPPIPSWKHSRIPFKKNQTHQVTISYKARYSSDSSAISDDATVGAYLFSYSLSPAATWNGPIQKGMITVNVLHPQPEEVKILKPKDRFQKISKGIYQWSFENLKPTLDDNIQISVHDGYESFPVDYAVGGSKLPGSYVIYSDRYYLEHWDYDVTASSTLNPQGEITYDAVNVKGSSDNRGWAEGVKGDGIGEHLDFTIKHPLPLDAILIIPGYDGPRTFDSSIPTEEEKEKAAALWYNNNRIARTEITLNNEFTFTASIPDEQFKEAYPILIRGYNKPVKTIKLVIAGVYPGAKYRDTCISEVTLRAKLSKKPILGPVR